MKALAALLIGIALMVGVTGAIVPPDVPEEVPEACPPFNDRTTSEVLTYSYDKTVESDVYIPGYVKEGDKPQGTDFSGTVSGAFFAGPNQVNPYDDVDTKKETVGVIQNKVVQQWAEWKDTCPDPYAATLHQGGTATLDLSVTQETAKDPKVATFDAYASKNQYISATGQFDNYGATFADCASVGTNYMTQFNDVWTDCGNLHLKEQSRGLAEVYTDDESNTWFEKATIGTQSYTGLSASASSAWNGCEEGFDPFEADGIPVMKGQSMSWAAFDEGFVCEDGFIKTFADTEDRKSVV